MKNLKIRSILESVIKEVEIEQDLHSAKDIVLDQVIPSGIKEQDKRTIVSNVESISNKEELVKYLYNSILKYSGYGVI